MRFAWLRETGVLTGSAEETPLNRLLFIVYNAVYWIPIVLPVIGVTDYKTGFILFGIIIFVRAASNLYRNNFLPLEKGEVFLFRSP